LLVFARDYIEKGRAVPYSDFVTILRRASMQYLHHDVTSTETLVPPPPKYNVMYPVDARGRTVKIPPVHKIVLPGLYQDLQPYKVFANK
jgi:hypothetical protein